MKNFDYKFMEQSKWILTPGNVKSFYNCPPMVSGCNSCVVYCYSEKEDLCTVEKKLRIAKNYLRNEKLIKINKNED